jgi:hypothetical protein
MKYTVKKNDDGTFSRKMTLKGDEVLAIIGAMGVVPEKVLQEHGVDGRFMQINSYTYSKWYDEESKVGNNPPTLYRKANR